MARYTLNRLWACWDWRSGIGTSNPFQLGYSTACTRRVPSSGRVICVCHTAASTGLPPCTPLDNFLFPSTTWQRELVANNPLPSTDDHSAAQWFDELRFQVWLPRFIRRRCENHFMMSYPHLTAPTELAILLEAPLTECLSSTEPQVLSIAGLDGYPGL